MHREALIAELATRQHGVVARRQLFEHGLTPRMIDRRLESGRLLTLHRGVYALGHLRLSRRGRWLAAVLACGPTAVLSHASAAALWGFARPRRGPVDVIVPSGRGRSGHAGIFMHEGRPRATERGPVDAIPVTTVPRTLLDLAEAVDQEALRRAFEEADRLRILEMGELEAVCARSPGRRALRPIRRMIDSASAPGQTRSPLEDRVLALCRQHGLPLPSTNVLLLGHEVDALWPSHRLVVEADGYEFHRHRAAFERDRARDATRQVEGYRVVRLTHRRLDREPAKVAAELRRLLNSDSRDGRAGS
jgi:predicted transcriptional regulator of viral defense system